eukprot:352246-Chlamydomonas_euryale.AAC.1
MQTSLVFTSCASPHFSRCTNRGPLYPVWPRKPATVGFTLFGLIGRAPSSANTLTFEDYICEPSLMDNDRCGKDGGERGGGEEGKRGRILRTGDGEA